MEIKNILKKLNKIQIELKAPKNQINSFGKYKYRSCEDITEAIKPYLKEYNCVLVMSDEIVHLGGTGENITIIKGKDETTQEKSADSRYYIKSSVTIFDVDSGESITTSACAREDLNKKGMDLSQLTGATSSYARKYALNGLFALDDTKDSDATNTHGVR